MTLLPPPSPAFGTSFRPCSLGWRFLFGLLLYGWGKQSVTPVFGLSIRVTDYCEINLFGGK